MKKAYEINRKKQTKQWKKNNEKRQNRTKNSGTSRI